MTNPPALFHLFGRLIRVHWSVALTIPLVAGHTIFTESARLALLYSLLAVAVLACVVLQGLTHVFLAGRLGIGTRDIVLYPFWTSVRLTSISERPWQEIYISVAGPLTHGLISALLALALNWTGQASTFPGPSEAGFDSSFVALLSWCNLFLVVMHLLPFLPLDMGQVFRSALSLTTGRLRATEIASHLSAVGSLGLLVAGLAWLDSPLLAFLAVSLYLSCQEDLGRVRYFASIRADRAPTAVPAPSILIPVEQIVDDACQPPEEGFSGFTWNRKSRLWIQWLDGRAVGANALVGD